MFASKDKTGITGNINVIYIIINIKKINMLFNMIVKNFKNIFKLFSEIFIIY